MKIALGADHRGFELKEKLKQYLQKKGYEIIDFGTESSDPSDYPDYAVQVARSVSKKESDKGVLVCWTGVGMSIAANKVKGIRAALSLNEEMAKISRQHNDANVLALSARFTNNSEAEKILEAFLKTEFEGGRHQRRVEKIKKYEE